MRKNKHFLYTPEGKLYLEEEYVKKDVSAYELAERLETYSNFIYRALRFHGIPRKDKSAAQKLAIQQGRASHPTAGKERSMSEKNAIGSGIHQYWKNLPKKEFKKRVDKSRELWYKVDEDERDAWRKKSHEKLREAAKDGSKAEKAIVAALSAHNFKVQVHRKVVLEGSEMSVDIFLPVELVIIEIDGPSHFLPIFGQEILEQTINRDLKKNQLLIAQGYKLIRISNQHGYHSKTVMDKFCKAFIPYLKAFIDGEKNFEEVLMTDIMGETNHN